jgi:DNA-binding HxlR family transcriptional regulator
LSIDGDGIALRDHLNRWGMKACPIDRSLKILGQRYALHIMRNMILLKQNRFSAFLSSIEGINTKTLSNRLHQLEKYGLIERKVISTKPTHTEYHVTEKGMAVQRILKEVASFSINYEPEMIFANESAKCNMESYLGVKNLSDVYGSKE